MVSLGHFPLNRWIWERDQYKDEVMENKEGDILKAFKKETVEYLTCSGKPIVHVARELGLNDAMVGIWKLEAAVCDRSQPEETRS